MPEEEIVPQVSVDADEAREAAQEFADGRRYGDPPQELPEDPDGDDDE